MREQGVPREHVFIDKQSGKDFDRPAYRQMMERLGEGDTLILKSLDRLGRNYREVQEQWRIITQVKKASIYVIDTPALDTRCQRDLCDHNQDGYTTQNAEKFFSMWFDHSILPKKEQYQPWIVAHPKG